jgi:hypothetical protein
MQGVGEAGDEVIDRRETEVEVRIIRKEQMMWEEIAVEERR